LIALVRGLDADLEIEWDNRAAINLRLKGLGRAWAQWRTKEARGLDCRFIGKKGQFNLSRIEKFGEHPEIVGRKEGEMVKLFFRQAEHVHAAALKEFLAEHLRGFKEMVSSSSRV
jgi:hypothetical protein